MSKGFLTLTRKKPSSPGEGRRGRPVNISHRPPRGKRTNIRPHLIQANRLRLMEMERAAQRKGEERLISMAAARAKKPWGRWQVGTIGQRTGLAAAYRAVVTRPKKHPFN